MNMNKTVIKILQGSVVTQTVLGGLTMYLLLQISYSIHRVQKKRVYSFLCMKLANSDPVS